MHISYIEIYLLKKICETLWSIVRTHVSTNTIIQSDAYCQKIHTELLQISTLEATIYIQAKT